MALLEEIEYGGSTESIESVYEKLNLLIQSFNAVLGGGDAGQLIAKVNGDDFNFEFIDQPLVKTKIIDIGGWNMQSTASVSVAHGLTRYNILFVSIFIFDDDNFASADLTQINPNVAFPAGAGGTFLTQNTNINMSRIATGLFDNSSYNNAAINRGKITIWYTE